MKAYEFDYFLDPAVKTGLSAATCRKSLDCGVSFVENAFLAIVGGKSGSHRSSAQWNFCVCVCGGVFCFVSHAV